MMIVLEMKLVKSEKVNRSRGPLINELVYQLFDSWLLSFDRVEPKLNLLLLKAFFLSSRLLPIFKFELNMWMFLF